MQVSILDKTFQIGNGTDAPQRLFALIEETLQGTEYHFSHLVIDGIAVYDQFEETILQSIDRIQAINVQVKTLDEFVRESLNSTREYLNRALPEIEALIDRFYQAPDQKAWSLFLDLLEGLQWIHQVVNTVQDAGYPSLNRDVFGKIDAELLQHYAALAEGLENKDHVLIADVIQYEVLPVLETLSREINSMVVEEKHHDTH